MQGHCPYCNQKLSTWCKAHSVSFTQDHTITHCATFLRERAEAAEQKVAELTVLLDIRTTHSSELVAARQRIAELEDERPLIRALVVDAKRIIQNCKGYYHDDALALLGRAAAALKEE